MAILPVHSPADRSHSVQSPETLADFLRPRYAPPAREAILAHLAEYGTLYSCHAIRHEHLADAHRLHADECERAEALAEMHRDDFGRWVEAREAGYDAAVRAADALCGHDPDEHALALDLAASGYDPRAIECIVGHYREHGSVMRCFAVDDSDADRIEDGIRHRLDPHPDPMERDWDAELAADYSGLDAEWWALHSPKDDWAAVLAEADAGLLLAEV